MYGTRSSFYKAAAAPRYLNCKSAKILNKIFLKDDLIISERKKDDGKLADVDEVLQFKVIEFEREDKRIIVSHTRVIEDHKVEEKAKATKDKKKVEKKAKDSVRDNNSKVEKSTLGDLDVLSELKAKMEKDSK